MTTSGWLLLVDDDPDIRMAVKALLNLEGYAVVEAVDGQDALEKMAAAGRPALILLDLRMPRMSGPELMAALKEIPALADVPVVVMSGDARVRETARAMAACGFLQKPVDPDRLVAAVAQHATAVGEAPAASPPG